jgi:hypothetical protein
MTAVWCVKHRDGYCAIRTGKPFKEGKDQVFTKCQHWIIFPWGCEEREPTCLECLEILETAKGH